MPLARSRIPQLANSETIKELGPGRRTSGGGGDESAGFELSF
jgi:hypothetical protein